MKRSIYAFFFLLFILPFSSLQADSWDCMDRHTAEKVLKYLSQNKWIMDYCDLCDEVAEKYDGNRVPATLVRISNLRIETCEWDAEQVSVYFDSEPILVAYLPEDYSTDQMLPFSGDSDAGAIESFASSMPVSLNYHWTLSDGKATRIGDVVDYSDKMDYETLQSFPPTSLIADKKSRKQYAKFLSNNR
jgi:hypothetical protein